MEGVEMAAMNPTFANRVSSNQSEYQMEQFANSWVTSQTSLRTPNARASHFRFSDNHSHDRHVLTRESIRSLSSMASPELGRTSWAAPFLTKNNAQFSRFVFIQGNAEEVSDKGNRMHVPKKATIPMWPHQHFPVFCDVLLLFCFSFAVFMVPLCFPFNLQDSSVWRTASIFCDIFFFTHFVVSKLTVYVDETGMVTETLSKLFIRELRWQKLFFDVNGILVPLYVWLLPAPWGLITWGFRFHRFLSLRRGILFHYYLTGLKYDSSFHPAIYRLMILLVFFTIFTHLVSCLWLAIGLAVDLDEFEESWITDLNMGVSQDDWLFQEQPAIFQYCVSLYFVITSLSTAGYGDINPNKTRMLEIWMGIVIIICGVAVFSALISITSSFVQDDDDRTRDIKGKMDRLLEYCEEMNTSMRNRFLILSHMRRMFLLDYKHNNLPPPERMVGLMSKKIRWLLFENVVKTNDFFAQIQLTDMELTAFFPLMQKMTYICDNFICLEGFIQKYVFIVHRGKLRTVKSLEFNVLDKTSMLMGTIYPGDVIGLHCFEPFLDDQNQGKKDHNHVWPFSVQAITDCCLFSIEQEEFARFFPKQSVSRKRLDFICKKQMRQREAHLKNFDKKMKDGHKVRGRILSTAPNPANFGRVEKSKNSLRQNDLKEMLHTLLGEVGELKKKIETQGDLDIGDPTFFKSTTNDSPVQGAGFDSDKAQRDRENTIEVDSFSRDDTGEDDHKEIDAMPEKEMKRLADLNLDNVTLLSEVRGHRHFIPNLLNNDNYDDDLDMDFSLAAYSSPSEFYDNITPVSPLASISSGDREGEHADMMGHE